MDILLLVLVVSLFVELLGVLSLLKVAQRPSGWPWHGYGYRTYNHLFIRYLGQKKVGPLIGICVSGVGILGTWLLSS